jgi:putative PIN family toxin of toxin-antitoxin system
MKVFLDTNVWLSATIFSGLCEALVTACADRDWLVTCPLVRVEAHEVLARKFPHLPQAPGLFDAAWNEVPPAEDVAEPADDNDARLVAAAVAAGADLFVTGDKRVLEWKQSGKLRIVTPREAWIMLFAPHLKH